MADLVHNSHTVRGYCALCTAHCATIATVTDGKVVRLEADSDHPNGGVFCIKGKAAPELVYHPDRLNFPLKRTRPKDDPDPGWQRVSWDEALHDIAERLNFVRETYGPRAVALAKGTGAELQSPMRSAGCRALSTALEVPTGFRQLTSVIGTRTPASPTLSGLSSLRPIWRTATPFCSGVITQAPLR